MSMTNHRKVCCTLSAVIALCTLTPELASSQVYKLPVPAECSSTKQLTLPRDNHPDNFKSYSKVDLYCGETVIAKGATFCDSDYDKAKPLEKTVRIAVSTAVTSGKAAACPSGTDLKIVPQ